MSFPEVSASGAHTGLSLKQEAFRRLLCPDPEVPTLGGHMCSDIGEQLLEQLSDDAARMRSRVTSAEMAVRSMEQELEATKANLRHAQVCCRSRMV